MFGNFVFDIDGAMAKAIGYKAEEVEQGVKEAFGEAFFEKHCLMACNYQHYIFPGYYALFRWLDSLGGKIFYFSSGIEERNVELAARMMKKAFGDAPPDYKVFSRKHCVDTTYPYMTEEEAKKYQSYKYGNRKKKLGGIVVPEEEVPNSLLIEDDTSYMTKGEEANLVYVGYALNYLQSSYKDGDNEIFENFSKFHKAYFLAGLLAEMFQLREERNMTLAEASEYVQYEKYGEKLQKDLRCPTLFVLQYYLDGKKILSKFDPDLEFYYPVPDKDGVSWWANRK